MLITNIPYARLIKIMRTFNSTFLNLFSDLANFDYVPPQWAYYKSKEIVGHMLENEYCEPTCSININNTAFHVFPEACILKYTSRSGKQYEFIISRMDWYGNSFDYPCDSQLAKEFEAIMKTV